MEKFIKIIEFGIKEKATDIHLLDGRKPAYRVGRRLVINGNIEELNKFDLESLLQYLIGEKTDIFDIFERKKRVDISYDFEDVRLRINVSMASGVPTFSIRIIKNKELLSQKFNNAEIINAIKDFNSGLILITGQVNSGKTTTLNSYVDYINNIHNKKIVMLEEPIEYVHKSKKSHIVQKEVGPVADIPSYYDGVINLLREDSDISIVGEIRDKKTMQAVLDLAESGGLVIGTLHTRSCSETLDRIIGLYDISEQKTIKFVLSTVLRAVVSQKLILDKDENTILVPEIMINNKTIAALIRKDDFNISEIRDAIHLQDGSGSINFEKSLIKLYKEGKITMDTIQNAVETEEYQFISKMIGGAT